MLHLTWHLFLLVVNFAVLQLMVNWLSRSATKRDALLPFTMVLLVAASTAYSLAKVIPVVLAGAILAAEGRL